MLSITNGLMIGPMGRDATARSRGLFLSFLLVLSSTMMACDAGQSTTTTPPASEGMRLDRSSVRIDEGSTARLRVLITDANGTQREMGSTQVVWSVRDPDIATVKDGLVTGLKPGSTQVSAILGGRQSAFADLVVLPVPGVIEILEGNGQAGVVGQPLLAPLRIRALNRQGLPMSGVQMRLDPVLGGSVSPSVLTLDANGIAEAWWTLGTRAGLQGVELRVVGRDGVASLISAEAAPGPVARVIVTPANALTVPGGRVRYSAGAVDEFGNAITHAPVRWEVVNPSIASVNTDGLATAIGEGETEIEAIYTSDGAAGGDVAAAAPPKETRGNGKFKSHPGAAAPQQVTDLSSPSQSFTSIVLRFTQVGDGTGNPAQYEVRYAETPIGSGFASANSVSQGTCQTPIAGTSIGGSINCSVDGLQSGKSYDFQVVAFRIESSGARVYGPESNVATARTSVAATPSALEIVGGNAQTAPVSTKLATPLVVRVKDTFGNAMPSVAVTWTVISGGGSVSASSTVTNSLGLAEVQWTLGAAAGAQQVRAGAGTLSTTFAATATAASVASVTVTPASATVQKGQSVQLVAQAKDAAGTIVPGALFSWTSSNAGVATVSSSGSVSGIAAGSVTVKATTGGKEATATVTVEEPPVTSTKPGTITTLAVESTDSNTVHLRFTEVNDGTGKPARYDIRFHVSPIGYNWGSAPSVSSGTCASLTGTTIGSVRRCSVTGLQPGVTYDFQMVAYRVDANGENVFSESLSNVATGRTTAGITISSVSITPPSATVQKGSTLQLVAQAKDAGGNVLSGVAFAWTSSDATKATVAPSGQVTGVAAGTVTIRASAGGKEAAATVTVEEPVTGTGLPAIVTTLAVEGTGQTSATLRFTEVHNGIGGPADYSVRYHISPIGWNWGSATEVSQGTCASVQGTAIGNVRRCTVEGLQPGVVYDFQLVSHRTGSNGQKIFSDGLSNVATGTTLASSKGTLAISPRGATLTAIGATQQFSVTARDANGATIQNPGVSWTSSSTAIATVDSNGMLTARGVGTIVLTAAAACCVSDQITVTIQPTVASITVDPSNASLDKGQSLRINATARDANGNPVAGTIAWQSTNAGVASVATDGTVRGENAGNATVIASMGGKAASTAVAVQETVVEPPPSGGSWPNMPAGMTIAIDEPFNSKTLPSAPAGPWSYSASWSGSTISAANGALRFNYPAGFAGGSSPGIASNDRSTMSFTNYYIGVRVRWSKPWEKHPSGVNKILYWGEASASAANKPTNQFVLNRRGDVVDLGLQWGQGYQEVCPIPYDAARNVPTPGCNGEKRLASTNLDDGLWHTIEVLAQASTNGLPNGRARVWVDGILQFDVTNIRWAPTGTARFFGLSLAPVWGGVGSFKPQNDWLEFDHLRTGGY